MRSLRAKDQEAREWVDRVPGLVAELLERWSCVIAGPVMAGWGGVVVPVRRVDGSGAMLKVSPPHEVYHFEATTLAAWAGRGAVLLLERDDANYAMLLEQLHAGVVGHRGRRRSKPSTIARSPGPTTRCPCTARATPDAADPGGVGDRAPRHVGGRGQSSSRTSGRRRRRDVRGTGPGPTRHDPAWRPQREQCAPRDARGLAGHRPARLCRRDRVRVPHPPTPALGLELRDLPDPARGLRRRIEIFADAAEIDVARALRWTQARAVQTRVRGPYDIPRDEAADVLDWMATTLAD